MKNNSYEKFFINFASKTRFAIILSLRNGGKSVGEITKLTKIEQSNISHHLKSLIACKILEVRKNGKKRIYYLNKKTVKKILRLVETHARENCSEGCRNCGGCNGSLLG